MAARSDDPVAGLADVVDELYVLPPEDFVARRDELAAQARSAGDKALAAAVKKLRRPTAGAWALNLLSREEAGLVEQLLEVGAALRQAQDDLDGGTMRELNEQRRGVVGALARRAAALARDRGHPLDAPVSRQVEQSLAAALADPDAGAAVTSGQLTRPVEASGFGFSLDPEAMAVPSLVLLRGGKAPVRQAVGRPSAQTAPPSRPGGRGTAGSLDEARQRRSGSGRGAGRDRQTADEAEQQRREAEQAERERLAAEKAEREAAEREAAERARAEAALQEVRDAVEAARAAQADAQRAVEDASDGVEEVRARLEAVQTERDELVARLTEVEEQRTETIEALAEQQGRQDEAAAALEAAVAETRAAEKRLRAVEKRP